MPLDSADVSPRSKSLKVITSTRTAAASEPPNRVNSNPSRTQTSWAALFSFTSSAHAGPLLASVVCALVAGTIKPVQSIVLGKVFDHFTKYGGAKMVADDFKSQVSKYSLIMTGLGIATLLFNGASFGTWITAGELQAQSARSTVFDSLLRKPISWFDTRKSGVAALVPRVCSQIRELQLASAQPLGGFVQQVAAALASLIIAFYYSWDLTLVTLCTAPIMAGCLFVVSAKIQPSIEKQQEGLADASRLATNVISSIETVKCFNAQGAELARYTTAISRAAKAYFKQAMGNSIQLGFLRCMLLLVFVQGFWYGHHLVVTGRKSTGDVVTTIWAALLATESLEAIMPQIIVVEKGRAAGAQLRTLVNVIDSSQDSHEGKPGEKAFVCRGDIALRNVSFSYPARPSQLALDDVSVDVRAGETTFIIGKSGSGKSTIGQLLMRFYSPSAGSIHFDSSRLDLLDTKWLRTNVTLVEQSSVLFRGSLRDNIAYGRAGSSSVTMDDVRTAAEFALLQETINDMPDGLDTAVGSKGTSMSGGQRQRMALARARMRDSPVLILDESTSALDHITRSLIMTAIRKWRKGRTTIIITHDISQIEGEDRVLIMEDGRVVQDGYRQSLDSSTDMPFHKFVNSGVLAASPVLHDGDLADEESMQDIDILLDEPIVSRKHRKSIIPSVFHDGRNSIMLQPTTFNWPQAQAGAAAAKSQARTAKSSLARSTHNPDRNLQQLDQPRSKRLSANMIQLLDRAGQLALERRSGMVHRREKKPTLQDDEEVGLSTAADHIQKVPSMLSILSTVWPVLDHRGRATLLAGIACTLVHAGATPLFSWIFSKLITTFYAKDGGSGDALRYSVGAIVIAVVDGISVFFLHILLETCGQQWVDCKRRQAMRKILDQPRDFFHEEKNSAQTLVANLDRSAEEMRNLLGRFAAFIFMGVIILAASIIWAMAESWKLTLVGLSVAPVSLAATRAFQKVSASTERACNDAADVAGAIMGETFTNIKTVRSLTLEDRFRDEHSKAGQQTLIVGFRRAAMCGFFHGLSESLVLFVTALVFYYGAVLAASGETSVASLLTVFSMLLFGLSNVTAILNYIPQIGSSKDTAQRLLDLVDLPDDSHEHKGSSTIDDLDDVTFHSLDFSYPSRPADLVLCGVDLCFSRGVSTALVGPSGSGKSTIAALLLKMYPLPPRPAGRGSPPLCIGRQDISAVSTESLRRCIAVVPQTAFIFAASVRDNIVYGLPDGSHLQEMDNVTRAARAAGIEAFIQSLPQGYDTLLGDGGAGVSGGQAQRLAIARALVRHPAALVLDEATSALDVESASLVRDTIQKLRAAQPALTVIMITHDEAMMRIADRVVMLDKGTVVDSGTFHELVRRGGPFARLLKAGEVG